MVVAGGSLSSTTEAMKSLYQLLHKKNQDALLRIVRPFFQMSLNLLGVSTESDPTILTGSIMVEQDDYAYATKMRNVKIEYCILLCQSILAFYLHKFESARLLMEKCIALKEPGILLSTLDMQVCFYDTMTAIGMAWVWIRKMKADADMDKKEKKHLTEQKAKLISSAERCLGKLRILARYAPANLNQRVHIIQAELNAINGNVEEADKLFQKAMSHAEENGQLSDRALACERAGLAMRSCGKEDEALNYLEDCCAMYRHWGALIKVNHVKGNVIPQAIYEWDT
jgi:tetratricopeptide (TPR) repeat protein